MSDKDYMAFVVEGEAREPDIINSIRNSFFKNKNYKVITLPAGQNIYMLWKRMKDDDFETDLIEVVREYNDVLDKLLGGISRDDFSEVYLFFDLDRQQDNLSTEDGENAETIIDEMLATFDNETENGKLYISYPMSEALRDYQENLCGDGENCCCSISDMNGYKNASAMRSGNNGFKKYDYEIWKSIINIFALRVSCLLDEQTVISYEEYCNVTPKVIYEKQLLYICDDRVFILSAFPEFLLDYFPISFWKSCVKRKELVPKCQIK
jgi:hypothetical protein